MYNIHTTHNLLYDSSFCTMRRRGRPRAKHTALAAQGSVLRHHRRRASGRAMVIPPEAEATLSTLKLWITQFTTFAFCLSRQWSRELDAIIQLMLTCGIQDAFEAMERSVKMLTNRGALVRVVTTTGGKRIALFEEDNSIGYLPYPPGVVAPERVMFVRVWQAEMQECINRDAMTAALCRCIITCALRRCADTQKGRWLFTRVITQLWTWVSAADSVFVQARAVLWPCVVHMCTGNLSLFNASTFDHTEPWLHHVWTDAWHVHVAARSAAPLSSTKASRSFEDLRLDPEEIKLARKWFVSRSPATLATYVRMAKSLSKERTRRRFMDTFSSTASTGDGLFTRSVTQWDTHSERRTLVSTHGLRWAAQAAGIFTPTKEAADTDDAPSSSAGIQHSIQVGQDAFFAMIPEGRNPAMHTGDHVTYPSAVQTRDTLPAMIQRVVIAYVLLRCQSCCAVSNGDPSVRLTPHALLRAASCIRAVVSRYVSGGRRSIDTSAKAVNLATLHSHGWIPPFAFAAVNRIGASRHNTSMWQALQMMMRRAQSPLRLPLMWPRCALGLAHKWASARVRHCGSFFAVVVSPPVNGTWTLVPATVARVHAAIQWLAPWFPALTRRQFRSVLREDGKEVLSGSKEQVLLLQMVTPVMLMTQRGRVLSLRSDGETIQETLSSPNSLAPLLSFLLLWRGESQTYPAVLGCLALLHHGWVLGRKVGVDSASLGSDMFVPAMHSTDLVCGWARTVSTLVKNGVVGVVSIDSIARTQCWHVCCLRDLQRTAAEARRLWNDGHDNVLQWGGMMNVHDVSDMMFRELTTDDRGLCFMGPGDTRLAWFVVALVLEMSDSGSDSDDDTTHNTPRDIAWRCARSLRCARPLPMSLPDTLAHRTLPERCPSWCDPRTAYTALCRTLMRVEKSVFPSLFDPTTTHTSPHADPVDGTHEPFTGCRCMLGRSHGSLTLVHTHLFLPFVDDYPHRVVQTLVSASTTLGSQLLGVDAILRRRTCV